jgi:hypothetical protein
MAPCPDRRRDGGAKRADPEVAFKMPWFLPLRKPRSGDYDAARPTARAQSARAAFVADVKAGLQQDGARPPTDVAQIMKRYGFASASGRCATR